MKQRVALGIEYDGSQYSGWQRQRHTTNTVQERLERAASKVANHDISVFCAGRTDAGVHALGQVVHFDSDVSRTERSWIRGINRYLPNDICVSWVHHTTEEFHARFKAYRRSYRYIIANTRQFRGALNRRRSAWIYEPLDARRMKEASVSLIGTHDFTSFRASQCQAKSPVKTIHHLDVFRQEDLIVINIEADAFLHHMVRNIAGVLIKIGKGEAKVGWCEDVLRAQDRKQGGVTAAPEGLYLTGVKYPDEYGIPETRSILTII